MAALLGARGISCIHSTTRFADDPHAYHPRALNTLTVHTLHTTLHTTLRAHTLHATTTRPHSHHHHASTLPPVAPKAIESFDERLKAQPNFSEYADKVARVRSRVATLGSSLDTIQKRLESTEALALKKHQVR